MKTLAAALVAALLPVASIAGQTTVMASPFGAAVPVSQVQPPVQKVNSIDGLAVGDTVSAAAGGTLLSAQVTTKTTTPLVEVVLPTTLSTGRYTLPLKAGDRIAPAGRLVDAGGHAYYLVEAPFQMGQMLTGRRLFAISDDGRVLDRAFKPTWHGAYEAADLVTATSGGDIEVTKNRTVGPALCRLTVKFLGGEDGVGKYRVISTAADGSIAKDHQRAAENQLRFVTLSGVQLGVTQIDSASVRGQILGLAGTSCGSL
jgi:hypothetical protein